jgi:hypothetical protein
MCGLLFAFFLTVLHERGPFRLSYLLNVALFGTLACVVFLPLWPQLRFKPAVRTLTINAEGLVSAFGSVSVSRSWKDVRSVEESDGAIIITGNNKNAFVLPERAFANSGERKQFIEAARQWHSAATA